MTDQIVYALWIAVAVGSNITLTQARDHYASDRECREAGLHLLQMPLLADRAKLGHSGHSAFRVDGICLPVRRKRVFD